jgi:hypothetical protein
MAPFWQNLEWCLDPFCNPNFSNAIHMASNRLQYISLWALSIYGIFPDFESARFLWSILRVPFPLKRFWVSCNQNCALLYASQQQFGISGTCFATCNGMSVEGRNWALVLTDVKEHFLYILVHANTTLAQACSWSACIVGFLKQQFVTCNL